MVEDPDSHAETVLYGAKTGYFRKDLIVFYNFNPLRYALLPPSGVWTRSRSAVIMPVPIEPRN
jgi:hypothetical protein